MNGFCSMVVLWSLNVEQTCCCSVDRERGHKNNTWSMPRGLSMLPSAVMRTKSGPCVDSRMILTPFTLSHFMCPGMIEEFDPRKAKCECIRKAFRTEIWLLKMFFVLRFSLVAHQNPLSSLDKNPVLFLFFFFCFEKLKVTSRKFLKQVRLHCNKVEILFDEQ